jgi:hypothetical protein
MKEMKMRKTKKIKRRKIPKKGGYLTQLHAEIKRGLRSDARTRREHKAGMYGK